jgi:hypothetical protein
MSWKDSISQIPKQKVLIKTQSRWRETISPVTRDGKDGLNGKDGRNGKDGKNGKDGSPGKNGLDGSKWFTSKDAPAETLGRDKDFCLSEAGDVYQKESGAWVKRISLKGSKGDTRYIGGGVTEDRVNQLIVEAINDLDIEVGGGTSQVIASTTSNLIITNQTDVIVKGGSPVTISLKAIADPLTTKVINKSSENVTVNIDGGGTISDVQDDTSFIIVPGNSFTFLPETGVCYHVS